MRYFILFFFVGLATLVLSMATFFGAFRPVEIEVGKAGPFYLLYREHRGAYHHIVTHIEVVEDWVASQNIACDRSFGEFFDDPEIVEPERLRSRAGCLLEAPLDREIPEGFAQDEVPERLFVQARFSGSPTIGPIKVYPRVSQFMEQEGYFLDGHPMEVYHILSEREMITHYYFPAGKVESP